MRAESMKMDRLTQRRQILQWRQEQMRTTMSFMNEWRTKNTQHSVVNSIVNPANQAWVTTKANVTQISGSGSGSISVTSTNAAKVGNYTMEVVQTAQNAMVRGDTRFKGTASDTASFKEVKLNELFNLNSVVHTDINGPKTGTITINNVTISVDMDKDSATTVMNRINESKAGVTMSFDSLRGVFTVASKESGEKKQIEISGTAVGDSILDFMGLNNINTKVDPAVPANQFATATGSTAHNLSVWEMGQGIPGGLAIFGGTSGGGVITINGTDINVSLDGSMSVDDIIAAVNGSAANVTMSYTNGRFEIKSNDANKDLTITGTGAGESILHFAGLASVSINAPDDGSRTVRTGRDAIIYFDGTSGSGDGVRIKQSSNVFEVEGLRIDISNAIGATFEADGTTVKEAGQSFRIGTERNVDAAIDMIREFVNQYNDLIRYINAMHSTQRPRTGNSHKGNLFEPLTDEQRQAMSEKEVEQWDEKAKTGLLHNDRDIKRLHSQLRSLMMEPVNLAFDKDGKVTDKIYLFEIGIQTVGLGGSATDRLNGVLEIDESRLRAALEADPERVQKLFARNHLEAGATMAGTNLAQAQENVPHLGLGFRLDEFMNGFANSLDSPLRLRAGGNTGLDVSENTMSRQIRDYNTRIEAMQKYLIRRENHYYAMFARMEQAMSKSNAQMDSLLSFASGGA
jgi:flagellar hook-associated protein 2